MWLIDSNALYNAMERKYQLSRGAKHEMARELLDLLCDAPIVDAVPVVRCKDCKYWITNNYYQSCGLLNIVVNNGDFFCSGGERKGGDE